MMSTDTKRYSDLLDELPDGRLRLLEGVHPIPELLELDAETVLERFRDSQVADFQGVVRALAEPDNPLHRLFSELRTVAEREPGNRFADSPLFQPGAIERLFLELHEHVMAHPVWRHPFFVRFFQGEFDRPQAIRFTLNYFNQVKNTRQCVALALGRFNGLMAMPYGGINERLSELTQIVLAQLVADEYGVGSHSVEEYPALEGLFRSRTHIVMYRQMCDGLGIPFGKQDLPLLPGVADNVLTQRLVAGNPAFTPLEALASVGLGMEWGVPEFFSLLLGGMIRFGWRNQVPLTQEQLIVLIAHVRYDVLHAIAVMMVTSLFVESEADVQVIKQATNTLMAGRYAMMTELYRHVFEAPCASLAEVGLEARYLLTDRRIEQALRAARAQVAEGTVVDSAAYRQAEGVPYLFAAGV